MYIKWIFFLKFIRRFKVLIETQTYTEGKIIYGICLKWKQGIQIFEIFSLSFLMLIFKQLQFKFLDVFTLHFNMWD